MLNCEQIAVKIPEDQIKSVVFERDSFKSDGEWVQSDHPSRVISSSIVNPGLKVSSLTSPLQFRFWRELPRSIVSAQSFDHLLKLLLKCRVVALPPTEISS